MIELGDFEAPFPWIRGVLVFRGAFHLGTALVLVGLQLSGVPLSHGWAVTLLLVAGAGTSLLGRAASRRGVLTALLAFDAGIATVVFATTGGPSNPFTLLYFVQVILAAVTLSPRGTAAVTLAASLGYGSLFLLGAPRSHMVPHGAYTDHLRGMWVAFTVTATLIGAFVSRLTQAFLREREIRSRTSRFLGLTTLAAGAAHELGNPLGTIKLVVADLERELRGSGHTEWADDARVVLEEVARAGGVLQRMAAGGGEIHGEGLRDVDVRELLSELSEWIGPDMARVNVRAFDGEQRLRLPVHATLQALAQLVKNGLDASPAGGRVEVWAEPHPRHLDLVVQDNGEGMSDEIIERAGEPFFSTKEPGQGMGLGLFLVQALVERVGGRIRLRSRPGQGTLATLSLPWNMDRGSRAKT